MGASALAVELPVEQTAMATRLPTAAERASAAGHRAATAHTAAAAAAVGLLQRFAQSRLRKSSGSVKLRSFRMTVLARCKHRTDTQHAADA